MTPPPPSLNWCLFLDVDGTLVELTATPSQTQGDPEIERLLLALQSRLNGAIALVSGREIQTLDALFAPLALPAAGLHGLERRSADGTRDGVNFPDARLDGTRLRLAQVIAARAGTLIEDKGRTLAVHFRLAPQHEAALRAAVAECLGQLGDDYQLQDGDMMFEIKPRGLNKGTAVRAFMREAPFAGRQPVFIGDDITDRDGFAAVESLGGVSIGVGDRVRGQYYLPGVGAVRTFLERIAEL